MADLGAAEFWLEADCRTCRVDLHQRLLGVCELGAKCRASSQRLLSLLLLLTPQPWRNGSNQVSLDCLEGSPVCISGWYKSQASAVLKEASRLLPVSLFSNVFSLPLRLLLSRQRYLSKLSVAEPWVTTQHRAHGSLILLTSDHSSRSARQKSLKTAIEKKNPFNPLSFLYLEHKRLGESPPVKKTSDRGYIWFSSSVISFFHFHCRTAVFTEI